MEKILKAKIVGACNGAWYKDQVGKTIEVKPFTHNYYLDAHKHNKTYNVKDLKILLKVNNGG